MGLAEEEEFYIEEWDEEEWEEEEPLCLGEFDGGDEYCLFMCEFSKVCEEIAETNALIREHKRRWIEEFLKGSDGREKRR